MSDLDEILRFSRALELNEGFVFHVVVADTRLVAEEAVRQALSEARWIRLDHTASNSNDELAGSVLAQLDEALDADETEPVVLDASASFGDEFEVWRRVFRRINEFRNKIAKDLDRPLILCISPGLETVFGHEAPDFWSIRGSGMRLFDRIEDAKDAQESVRRLNDPTE